MKSIVYFLKSGRKIRKIRTDIADDKTDGEIQESRDSEAGWTVDTGNSEKPAM